MIGHAGRITLLVTSPRVAPGLLTRAAWLALSEASQVGAVAVDVPSVQAVTGSGIAVTPVPGDTHDHWSWLTGAALAGSPVVWLVGDDGEPALLRLVADAISAEPRPPYEVEIVHGSYDVPGARLIDLVRVMDRLRSQCPWDRQQTHRSLAKYLLEETYETLEAIESGDRAHLREELGDLLLQVAFHSRIAEEGPDPDSEYEDESGAWSVDDVAGDIVEKLVRRHPHVFADTVADGAAAVEANWETIKADEKQRASAVEGIPLALPALALADQVLSRAAKVLLSSSPGVAASSNDYDRYGEELLELVRRTRESGVDAEQALRDAVRRVIEDIRTAEAGP
jgi:XTP/dITP diphosphohydrolase